MTIRNVGPRKVATVSARATPVDAARAMRRHGVRRLPVVDERGELVGVVALDDLLRFTASEVGSLAEALRRRPSREAPRGDTLP